MKTYEFEIELRHYPTGAIERLDDKILNELFEAGCDDSTVVSRNGRTFIVFAREAETEDEAIKSAMKAVGNNEHHIVGKFYTMIKGDHEIKVKLYRLWPNGVWDIAEIPLAIPEWIYEMYSTVSGVDSAIEFIEVRALEQAWRDVNKVRKTDLPVQIGLLMGEYFQQAMERK